MQQRPDRCADLRVDGLDATVISGVAHDVCPGKRDDAVGSPRYTTRDAYGQRHGAKDQGSRCGANDGKRRSRLHRLLDLLSLHRSRDGHLPRPARPSHDHDPGQARARRARREDDLRRDREQRVPPRDPRRTAVPDEGPRRIDAPRAPRYGPPRSVSLLDKRLILVGGKGGVGRSTVAAAIATTCASRGRKTLLFEANANDRFGSYFGAAAVGTQITQLAPNLSAVNTTPAAALQEYGLMILKFKTVYNAIFENRITKAFLRAVPGMDD